MKHFTTKGKTHQQFKKLVLTGCLLVLTVFSSLNAQIVFSVVGINNGSNASTGYPAPYGNYYWGSHHQMFVTAAELTAAGIGAGVNIRSIGFNIVSLNSGVPHQNWVVTVYTTTSTNPINGNYVTTGQVSTSTLTTVTGVLGWNTTTISPFIWNGTDNLIIETCTYNGSYVQNYSTSWTSTLPGTSTKTFAKWQDVVTSCAQVTLSVLNSTNTRPDMRFEWEYLTPCSGVPPANSILTPTFQVCPNVPYGLIGLATTYTVGGLTYQWMQATASSAGPFSPVPSGGTAWAYSVPGLTTTTWYQAVITCTNGNQSYTTAGSPVQVAATTTSVVPYYEDFESIGQPNRLPNCSWWCPNQGTTVKTYTSSQSNNRVPRSGVAFGAFELPSNNNAVYSNGIQLSTGITYSAAIHYATEYFGYNNWSKLEILVGPNQSTTGLVQVAQVGPAVSGPYKLLSGTFVVPSPGLYYVCFRATAANGSALYLSFDDLSVTIPCTPASGNSATVSASSSASVICAGDQVNLTATGGQAYLWSTGATSAAIVVTPAQTTIYSVVGTNTLTGCSSTQAISIGVLPSPTVFVVASQPGICKGQSTFLTGFGADSYAWSNGGIGNVITVSPTVATTYSAIGTTSNGCSSTGVTSISIKPSPTITVISNSNTDICAGEMVSLQASGGVSYSWVNGNSGQMQQGNPLLTVLTQPTTFTVEGLAANGCSAKNTITQNVVACVGLEKYAASKSGITIFPIPTTDMLNITSASGNIGKIEILDLSGRVVRAENITTSSTKLDISALKNGVYFVKIMGNDNNDIIRIIKD